MSEITHNRRNAFAYLSATAMLLLGAAAYAGAQPRTPAAQPGNTSQPRTPAAQPGNAAPSCPYCNCAGPGMMQGGQNGMGPGMMQGGQNGMGPGMMQGRQYGMGPGTMHGCPMASLSQTADINVVHTKQGAVIRLVAKRGDQVSQVQQAAEQLRACMGMAAQQGSAQPRTPPAAPAPAANPGAKRP